MVLVDTVLDEMKETSGKKQGGGEPEKFSTRIVSESSELHRTAPPDVKCETEEEMSHEKDPNRLYSRSKLFKWVTHSLTSDADHEVVSTLSGNSQRNIYPL